MKKRGRRAIALLLTLSLFALCPLAAVSAQQEQETERSFAYEGDFAVESLGAVIERYLEKKGLPASNIAIGWYDLQSGEEWYYNPDTFIYGASTYKLPLAMLYLDKIHAGELSWDTPIAGSPLEERLHRMVADSNNAAADALWNALSLKEDELRVLLAQYSGLGVEKLPHSYYGGSFSPRFLIGTLRTLYEHADEYSQILEYMKEARPTSFLSLYRGERELAHKYGAIPGYACDSGIVYAERPFLMTVMTRNLNSGMTIIGELGAIAMDYADYLAQQPEATPESTPEPTPEPTPQPTPAPTPAPTPEPTAQPTPAPSPAEEAAAAKAPGLPPAQIAGTVVLAAAVLAAGFAYKKRNP